MNLFVTLLIIAIVGIGLLGPLSYFAARKALLNEGLDSRLSLVTLVPFIGFALVLLFLAFAGRRHKQQA